MIIIATVIGSVLIVAKAYVVVTGVLCACLGLLTVAERLRGVPVEDFGDSRSRRPGPGESDS